MTAVGQKQTPHKTHTTYCPAYVEFLSIARTKNVQHALPLPTELQDKNSKPKLNTNQNELLSTSTLSTRKSMSQHTDITLEILGSSYVTIIMTTVIPPSRTKSDSTDKSPIGRPTLPEGMTLERRRYPRYGSVKLTAKIPLVPPNKRSSRPRYI